MRIAFAAVLLLVLPACGREAGPTDSGMLAFAPSGEYVVTAVTVDGADHALVEGSEARLSFDDGKLGITAGCNHLFGDYSLAGDRLTAGAIGGTEMGCPEPLMAQDTWLAKLFSGDVTIGRDPLTLTAGDTVLTLTPRADVHPDTTLLGTAWALDGLIEGDSVSSIPAGPPVVLTLSKRSASVTGLCNGFGADVTLTGDEITWTPGMRTLIACADPARQQLDTTVSGILAGATSYTIEEATLTLTNGKQGLTFRAS
ncbi:META domain-containing protein [Nocardioides cavernaquae]|uniref:META domain-containing protein n=1 Tax=Nocardioides cavernaquae TaxID=2321396 RepID=A0A3A5H4V1_9ACTN|nr:META domain-containing protein [Nocardioides cavernaquae]RJS44921.1 META domain-containing protein [Nocardioides cavernaquae]